MTTGGTTDGPTDGTPAPNPGVEVPQQAGKHHSQTPHSTADSTVTIARISPLSALKVGTGFGVTLFVVWMIAVAIVWFALQAAGVWDRLNSLLADLFGLSSFSAGLFFGIAGVLGVLEVLVVVFLAPLAAVVYNNGEQLFGGLKIELKAK